MVIVGVGGGSTPLPFADVYNGLQGTPRFGWGQLLVTVWGLGKTIQGSKFTTPEKGTYKTFIITFSRTPKPN